MSTKRLRVGVLGQGRSGFDIHVRWLREDPEKFEIVAVADLDPERMKDAAKDFGAKTYDDYKKLLADKSLNLDLIVNALPSFLHPKGTIDTLNAGYDLVCEKPLAPTAADFDEMVKTAEKNGKKLLPFQNSRFQPFFKKMQEVIASGKLGRVINIRSNWSGFSRRWDWQTRQEYWGGNLLNTGPHPMDHAIVLYGESMPKVFCRMVSDNPYGDAENFCSVNLYGEDGPNIEVSVSSFQAYPQGEMYNISATRGGLTGGPAGLKWKYYIPETAPEHEFKGEWSPNRGYCSEKLDWIEETWKYDAQHDTFNNICRGFYDNAYDILVNDAKRIITLDQVRRQVAVMEECHRQNPLPKSKEKFLNLD